MLGSANMSRSGGLSPVRIIILISPPLLPSLLIANANATRQLHTNGLDTILDKLDTFLLGHAFAEVCVAVSVDIR